MLESWNAIQSINGVRENVHSSNLKTPRASLSPPIKIQIRERKKKKRKISGNGGRCIDEVLLGSKHLLRWHPSSSRSKFPLPILKFVIRQCLVVPIWNWRLFVHRLVLESKCLSSISSELWILQIQPSLISPWYSNLSQLKPHAITKLV